MHCHDSKEAPPTPHEGSPIVLVGNPNVGKSVLFSLLTGRYVTVSNYPGTTVEVAANLAKSVAVNPAEKDGARRDRTRR